MDAPITRCTTMGAGVVFFGGGGGCLWSRQTRCLQVRPRVGVRGTTSKMLKPNFCSYHGILMIRLKLNGGSGAGSATAVDYKKFHTIYPVITIITFLIGSRHCLPKNLPPFRSRTPSADWSSPAAKLVFVPLVVEGTKANTSILFFRSCVRDWVDVPVSYCLALTSAIGHRFGVTAPTGGGCPTAGGQTHLTSYG